MAIEPTMTWEDHLQHERAQSVARALVADCERDLQRKLTQGEQRDLLMDNTTWSRSAIVAVVASL
jgi:hypothetical protein